MKRDKLDFEDHDDTPMEDFVCPRCNGEGAGGGKVCGTCHGTGSVMEAVEEEEEDDDDE